MSAFEFYVFRVGADGTWSQIPGSIWAADREDAELRAALAYRGEVVVQSRASYETERLEREPRRQYGEELED